MKKGKGIMLQGTASSVGKSLLTAALCRIFVEDGFSVTPFKSQNMALNSFITEDGLEMGRAQVMQAEAAKIKPSVLMNPILLKPTAEKAAQVVMNGKVYKNMTASEYHQHKPKLKDMIGEIYQKLIDSYDIVVIEGAGSPAEINLKENDIVNMGMAEIADCPVILIGDIDRGGVFASIYGTIMLLDENERKRVKGLIINKFRGDRKILEPGLKMIEELTGIPVIGVMPYGNLNIEDEDSVTDRFKRVVEGENRVKIDIIRLPYISNFTDFHIFDTIPEIQVQYISHTDSIDNPDIIIIPGSKNTISDLKYLRDSGLEVQILKAYNKGAFVFGICGGYQMLGKKLTDPDSVEGSIKEIEGLGLLDIETNFEGSKVTTQVEGLIETKGITFNNDDTPMKVSGYEIHMGRTVLHKNAIPFIRITNKLGTEADYYDGAIGESGRVFGTYLHGVFDEMDFTTKLVNYFLEVKGLNKIESTSTLNEFKENEYNKLANLFRENVDIKTIYKILGEESPC
ncbi:cobyric acid synthase [Alkaliphilus peptidifermentans]|uniref:Cobyric acid synthase n=1 Tax=Alkaliphilus peptidifermentans DSM 18978 TaxID=1120976 RepID=A0A1G5K2H0_9FIRM|nr:cobyric acid synthase [Alkaliphilus peptidifermentans]SCY94654.1 adenosylcobyric acid synthase (glutamine-hydrolysing) [Alkaliphilus peptidifermentans DSM 18978]